MEPQFNYNATPQELYEEVEQRNLAKGRPRMEDFPEARSWYLNPTNDVVDGELVWFITVPSLKMAFATTLGLADMSELMEVAHQCMGTLLQPHLMNAVKEALVDMMPPKEEMN